MATNKKDTTTPSGAPISGARARASEITARRGRVRDALAVIGNVEAMLRSKGDAAFDDEIAELRGALAGLRETFAAAPESLAAFALARVTEVEAALASPRGEAAAATLAKAAAELETAAGLLELVERANEGATLEVSVATLAEQAVQLAWTIRSHGAFGVHVRQSEGDCSVSCDPHVVARFLAIAISAVREVTPAVVVRTHVEDDAGVIEVTGFAPGDEGARVMQTRLVPRIAPTDAIFAQAARAAGIALHVEPGRILLRCPRAVS